MKIILFVLFSFCCIISINSRLIDSVKERTLATDTKTVTSPPLRVPRQIDTSREEISEEDHFHSEEYRGSQKKKRIHNKSKLLPNLTRTPRASNEHTDKTTKNITATSSVHTPIANSKQKSKPTVSKKPMPKFNDMDYDDDFQMKVNRSPIKVIDSGEHEDEDFNLDDYDFDVNHDEFVGRGKPLEPRIKHVKEHRENNEAAKPAARSSGSDNKSKGKVNTAPQYRGAPKRERSAENNKKSGEKDDYYDESTTVSKTKVTEKHRHAEEELNEENEESKEDALKAQKRAIRSPSKFHTIDKYHEKRGISKVLSILPMFPQLPGKSRRLEYNVGNDPNFSWAINVHKI